ncbi:MAG TPA: hypothetical protein PLT34_03220 [Muribaculaceae bacterium]|nr:MULTISPECIES: hypothetical protein [Bacteroidales]HUN20251.1 hypothetical protein [Muribaculaceae bacterium]
MSNRTVYNLIYKGTLRAYRLHTTSQSSLRKISF